MDIVREEAYDLVIQRGLGGGLFDPSQLLATLEEPIDVVLVGDLNGDSLPELVALWETGFNAQISIWTNLGEFAFELGGQLGFVEFRSEPTDGELADLDGDGDLDLVMSSSPSVFWLENLGSGTFGEPQVLTDNATVEAVDIDGDGDLDLVTVENRSLVEWLANLGGGRFGPPLLIASPGQLTDHSVSIDVDDDGRPEIAWGKNSGETIEYVPNLVP